MPKHVFKITIHLVTAIAVTLLFSCENNLKNVSKFNLQKFVPVSEALTIDLQHTDSGKIVAILKSPKMLDFSNAQFPYTEFPDGIHLTVYDKKGQTSNIYASYGVSYTDTKIIDLRDSVKIVTYDNKILQTEQLYYNQMEEWFFTDKKCKFSNTEGD